MDNETLLLVAPIVDLREEYLAFVDEFRSTGQPRYMVGEPDREDFAGYVKRLEEASRGINLKPGYVPASTFWLLRASDRRIVGQSSLRHYLVPSLEVVGGHIGYGIRPGDRRRGYGTRILALTLEEARRRGLNRVLVTCDDDNIGSARIIEKNGGILQDCLTPAGHEKPVRRYWIDVL